MKYVYYLEITPMFEETEAELLASLHEALRDNIEYSLTKVLQEN